MDACACLRFQAVDWLPFAEPASDLVNVVTAVHVAMPTVVLVVMDSIVDFCLAVANEPIASIAVALSLIAVSAVPSHLVDYVAFYS